MTPDEMIAVIQAHKDGKKIQSKIKRQSSDEWMTVTPAWNFDACDYRIKPEPKRPREWWINFYPTGVTGAPCESRDEAMRNALGMVVATVHVREVLPEE